MKWLEGILKDLRISYLPHAGTVLGEAGEFLLHTVHTVHGVNEQDKDEDERDLEAILAVVP